VGRRVVVRAVDENKIGMMNARLVYLEQLVEVDADFFSTLKDDKELKQYLVNGLNGNSQAHNQRNSTARSNKPLETASNFPPLRCCALARVWISYSAVARKRKTLSTRF